MRDFRLTTCPCGEIHIQARPGERCAACRHAGRIRLMTKEKRERVKR